MRSLVSDFIHHIEERFKFWVWLFQHLYCNVSPHSSLPPEKHAAKLYFLHWVSISMSIGGDSYFFGTGLHWNKSALGPWPHPAMTFLNFLSLFSVIPLQKSVPATFPLFSMGKPILHVPVKELLMDNHSVPQQLTSIWTVNGSTVLLKVSNPVVPRNCLEVLHLGTGASSSAVVIDAYSLV